jgi:hypothetical protein
VVAFLSAFQTAAYAGYPTAWVKATDRFVPFAAQIPMPPCGLDGGPPCPSRTGYVLHAEAGRPWRLRVPKETGPVDASGSDVEGFRSALARMIDEDEVHAVVVHLANGAAFGQIEAYLHAMGELHDRPDLGPITLSFRPFDAVPAEAPRRSEQESPVGGRLPPEEIQRAVRAEFGEFRKCYEDVLRRQPDARGRVRVDFVIATDGTVAEVTVEIAEGNLPTSVGTCIDAHFRRLVFPKPAGGIVRVTYPIVFTPGD